VNSLPKTVTRQRRDCDLNPGLSVPESSTLTTRLPNHPTRKLVTSIHTVFDDNVLCRETGEIFSPVFCCRRFHGRLPVSPPAVRK